MKSILDNMECEVDESTGCWNVTGKVAKTGYKPICRSIDGKAVTMYAHIEAFKMSGGVLEEGQLVCHHCDNKRCINPWHLFAGTYKDNAIDMCRKERGVSLLTNAQATEIILKKSWSRGEMAQWARRFGVPLESIGKIVRMETKNWLRKDLGLPYLERGTTTEEKQDNNEKRRIKYREHMGPKPEPTLLSSYAKKFNSGNKHLITEEERSFRNQWLSNRRLERMKDPVEAAKMRAAATKTTSDRRKRIMEGDDEQAKERLRERDKKYSNEWYAKNKHLPEVKARYRASEKRYQDKKKQNDITNKQLPTQVPEQGTPPDNG